MAKFQIADLVVVEPGMVGRVTAQVGHLVYLEPVTRRYEDGGWGPYHQMRRRPYTYACEEGQLQPVENPELVELVVTLDGGNGERREAHTTARIAGFARRTVDSRYERTFCSPDAKDQHELR